MEVIPKLIQGFRFFWTTMFTWKRTRNQTDNFKLN